MKIKLQKIIIASAAALGLSGLQFWIAMKYSRNILWQVDLMHWLVGPGPLLGYDSNGKPQYEGTPVHILAAYLGLLIGFLIYAVIIFILINRRQPNGTTKKSHNKSVHTDAE
jgi:hypothetical protein